MFQRPPNLPAFLRKKDRPGLLDGMGMGTAYSGEQIPAPSFVAPLTTNLTARGAGSTVPTFTRATTATVTDWESVVRPVLSGEVRFQGARRVANLITFTEDFSNAAWVNNSGGTGSAPIVTANAGVAPNGSITADRLQLALNGGTAGGDLSSLAQIYAGYTSGHSYVFSVWIKSNTTLSYSLRIVNFNSQSTSCAVTTTWQRFSFLVTPGSTTGSTVAIRLRGSLAESDSADLLVWGAHLEEVTGQSNTNPSEYVSVGVLAAPYHGANVDGVKYFDVENNNIVQQNLVVRSQSLSAAGWSAANVTITDDTTVAPDGTTTADTVVASATGACRDSIAATLTTGQIYTFSAYLKQGTSQGFISVNDGGGTNVAYAKCTLSGGGTITGTGALNITVIGATIENSGSGWYRASLTFVASAVTTRLAIGVWNTSSADASNYPGAVSGNTVIAWGAQVNSGYRASTYVATVAAVVNNNIVEDGSGAPPIASTTLLGYLAEGARTNLCLQSEDAATTWVATDTTITVNNIVAPDGNTTADLLTEGVAGTAILTQAISPVTADATYTASMWVKRGNHDFIRFVVVNGANFFGKYFNINTGVVGTTTIGGTGTLTTSSITAYPNSWYRITIVGTIGSGLTAISMFSASATADNNATRVNNGTRYQWGAQFENNVSFASSYIPTTTVSVARNADALTYVSAGNIGTSAFSCYVECIPLGGVNVSSANGFIMAVDDGTTNNRYNLFSPLASALLSGRIVNAGVSTNPGDVAAAFTNNIVTKCGLSAATGANSAVDAAGGTLSTKASPAAVPVVTTIHVGCDNTNVSHYYAAIRNLRFWTVQLSDNQLKILTR